MACTFRQELVINSPAQAFMAPEIEEGFPYPFGPWAANGKRRCGPGASSSTTSWNTTMMRTAFFGHYAIGRNDPRRPPSARCGEGPPPQARRNLGGLDDLIGSVPV